MGSVGNEAVGPSSLPTGGGGKADGVEDKQKAEWVVVEAGRCGAKEVDLSFLFLRQLPEGPEGAGLTRVGGQLEVLNLAGNQLHGLPDAVFEATPLLRRLLLAGNLLSELPRSLGLLAQLEQLDVSRNRLAAVPDLIANCTALTDLNLTENHLEVLPPAIGASLRKLQRISVGYNQLKTLPGTLGDLPALTHLDARFNRLSRVPPSLGRAITLQYLNLSGNFVNLTELPATLGKLVSLTHLDVSDNQISELPVELGRLGMLQDLALKGNPLRSPPLDLVEMAMEAGGSSSCCAVVKAYLAQKLKEREEASRTAGAADWAGWVGSLLGNWTIAAWLGRLLGGVTQGALEGASTVTSLELPRTAGGAPASAGGGSRAKTAASDGAAVVDVGVGGRTGRAAGTTESQALVEKPRGVEEEVRVVRDGPEAALISP